MVRRPIATTCYPPGVATAPSPTVSLEPLNAPARPIEDWVTTFHLAMVVVDPFTYESAWLLETAGRILTGFRDADCRICWLVTGSGDDARSFLGPLSDTILTFVDPDREVVRSLGLERLPAFVHLDHALGLQGVAEGWNPLEWRGVADGLAKAMSWSRPNIPAIGDPTPMQGTPALP